jgi:hypothetical protein
VAGGDTGHGDLPQLVPATTVKKGKGEFHF